MCNKNVLFFVVMAAFMPCFGSQQQPQHLAKLGEWRRVAEPATAVGASVGSAMFYFNQKKPRNKWLALFVVSCGATQAMRFADSPMVIEARNQMRVAKNEEFEQHATLQATHNHVKPVFSDAPRQNKLWFWL